uniref:Protein transport protein SEC31-like n=1 Tax=Piliocolobus tephrosceles TaxID=591936 RepID=A0A8C9G9L0_9PRIM
MTLKSINISGNVDWCPLEEHKNYLLSFNSKNISYSSNTSLSNYVYLLDINLNSDTRNLEIVSKLNFEEALKIEEDRQNEIGNGMNKKNNRNNNNSGFSNDYVTCFEWVDSSSFIDNDNDGELNATVSKGLVVGGLTNGDVVLLNGGNLFDREPNYNNFILSKLNVHSNSITCIECNKHKNNLIATGGCDGQVFITDIENIYCPTSYDPYFDKDNYQKITALNWNMKVSHILATSSNNGSTIIWDLKLKKSAVSFKDPHNRTKTSSISWLANHPTQILVAYDDDKNPCLQLWDLRNFNYPIKEIIGHSKGINNISFSSIDKNLLLSTAKDLTKCWYLNSNNNSFDIFNEISNSANNIYSKWSPFFPDLFASVTNMDTIQINSINNGSKMTNKYIPSFYKKDAGICFGFGGKLCYFDNTTVGMVETTPNISTNTASNTTSSPEQQTGMNVRPYNTDEQNASIMTNNSPKQNQLLNNNYLIKCLVYSTDKELVSEADFFEKYLETGNYSEFCNIKINKSEDDHEKLTWRILQLLSMSKKTEIVKYLGYDMNDIIHNFVKYTGGKQPGFLFNSYIDNINNTTNNLSMTDNNILSNSVVNNTNRNQMQHINNDKISCVDNSTTCIGSTNQPGSSIYYSDQTNQYHLNNINDENNMLLLNKNRTSTNVNNLGLVPNGAIGTNQDAFNEPGLLDVDPEQFFKELGEKSESATSVLKEVKKHIKDSSSSFKKRRT